MGMGPNWYENRNKTCYIQEVTLTDLKVSALAYKYAFYRLEHNAKERTPWN